jgi:LmbE family N-acetylglucosaminyl deacetylase
MLVAARPHYRQRGNELKFFLSERIYHALTAEEARVWEQLKNGPVSRKELDDEDAIRSLAKAGTIELIHPISAINRRRILVIEPHSDDAALSIGATMWKIRNEVEFHLLTMASRSNYTTAFHLHRNFFNRAEITTMRTAEGKLFSRHLGGHYYCAGMPEATLRYEDSDWDLEFFKAHEVPTAISNNRRAPCAVLQSWTDYLKDFFVTFPFEEIWIPLGAGNHSDHDLTRNAALQACLENQPIAVVRLYEDVPYGTQFQEHTDRLLRLLKEAGAKLTPWPQEVTLDFPSKLSLLETFASQFKVPAILPAVQRSAGASIGPNRVERMWTVEQLPAHIPKKEMWVGAPELAQSASKVKEFLSGSESAARLAIFAISPSGRWAEDLSVLSALFPQARLVIYAGPRACAEFLALRDARVEVHHLDGSSTAWIKAAFREFTCPYRIIIAGDTLSKAEALMFLWPGGHKVAVTGMHQITDELANS